MADIEARAVELVQASYVGISLITAERLRQIAVEGYTVEHDAEHGVGELVAAAVAYLLDSAGLPAEGADFWPFSEDSFKPGQKPLDSLVKAGALIAAEIDRIVAEEDRRVAVAQQKTEG